MPDSAGTAPMTAPSGRRVAVLAAALAAVALWGATPIATKLAVAGLDPLAVGLLRTLLAGLLALPVIVAARLALPRGRSGLGLLAVSAAGGFVVFPVLFSLGLGLTSAAHGALILAILPVTTGLIAAAVERAWPRLRWWAGAGLAAAGTVFLVGQRFGFAGEGDNLRGASLEGDLLVLASALAASSGYVAGARAAREAGTWAVTFWGLVLGGLVLLPLLPFAVSVAELRRLDIEIWGSLLYLAGISSILAYAAWYWALGQGDMGRIGLTQFMQPIIGLALAAIVLSEVITLPLVLSAATIIGGVILAQSGRAAAQPKP